MPNNTKHMSIIEKNYRQEIRIVNLQKENEKLKKEIEDRDRSLIEYKEKYQQLDTVFKELKKEQERSRRRPSFITEQESFSGFEKRLKDDMIEIFEMLLEKNASYGNSALDPIRVFSKANSQEQILVRIDDKLSRIKRGHSYPGDNDVKDLIGYFFLFLQTRYNNTDSVN